MIPHPRRRCRECPAGQKELALYGKSTPERCETHREENDLDLVQRRCQACELLDIVDEDGLCASTCSKVIRRKMHLFKQKRVRSYLQTCKSIPCPDTYDQPMDTRCGRERPDFAWDCGTHWVMLEVDENQHQERDCDCEKVRMINVTQTMGMPVYWLRYNPDKFRGEWSDLKDSSRHGELRRSLLAAFKSVPAGPSESLRVKWLYFDDCVRGVPFPQLNIPLL